MPDQCRSSVRLATRRSRAGLGWAAAPPPRASLCAICFGIIKSDDLHLSSTLRAQSLPPRRGKNILLFCKHTVKDDKFVLLFAVYVKDKAGAVPPGR